MLTNTNMIYNKMSIKVQDNHNKLNDYDNHD